MSSLPATAARVLVPLQIQGEPAGLDQRMHELQGLTMGTSWSVRLVGPAMLQLPGLQAAVQRVCDRVVAQMSHWEAGSTLSRFNRLAPGQSLQLPQEFARVLDAALHIARASDGAYDPAAGELVGLWGFGPHGQRHQDTGFQAPAAAQCAALPAQPWRELHWAAAAQRLTQLGRARLDLSAIAKGYAVDAVSQTLLDCGLPHHLVEIGGELRGCGFRPGGQPWWVDLEQPESGSGLHRTRLALHGLSVATSGDYRRCYDDQQGRRLSHTLDPRSRHPITHGLASVSVVHESAMWADGWSTALMVLGPEAGMALARREGLAALLLRRRSVAEGGGFEELLSPALQALAT
jgi:thiamine biosynthesis lipoprotein